MSTTKKKAPSSPLPRLPPEIWQDYIFSNLNKEALLALKEGQKNAELTLNINQILKERKDYIQNLVAFHEEKRDFEITDWIRKILADPNIFYDIDEAYMNLVDDFLDKDVSKKDKIAIIRFVAEERRGDIYSKREELGKKLANRLNRVIDNVLSEAYKETWEDLTTEQLKKLSAAARIASSKSTRTKSK